MFLKELMYLAIIVFTSDLGSTQSGSSNISDDFVLCPKDWYYFRQKCYKILGRNPTKSCTRKIAEMRCTRLGGNLVSIHSQEEQDFLIAFLLLEAKTTVWIGLSNKKNSSWTDGSNVTYTDWIDDWVATTRGRCIGMIFSPYEHIIGKWKRLSCDTQHPYICQKKPYNRKHSPNPQKCESGGMKYETSCYHIVTEEKTWNDSEQYCIDNYKGHLVTILDITVAIFLNYILLDEEGELWIGMKIQNQYQQKWTSGWYVGYNEFVESDEFTEGVCVVWTKRKMWDRVLCSEKYSFICEESTVIPPVLKLPVEGSYCPETQTVWRDLGGEFCYFIETENEQNWKGANFECLKIGGQLLSIHSKEESEILSPLVRYTNFNLFIGLFRSVDPVKGNQFKWSDGSPMDYENWVNGEPNSISEMCGEIYTNNMQWNNIQCSEKRGYICSMKKVTPKLIGLDRENTAYSSDVYLKALIGVTVCIILLIIVFAIVKFYFRRENIESRDVSTVVHPKEPPPLLNDPQNRPSVLPNNYSEIADDSVYEVMH